MRILVISDVPWRDDNSVGNTYSNIFKNGEDIEFANLYCKPGVVDTPLVKKYFQLTEKEIINSLLVRKKKVQQISHADLAVVEFNQTEQKFYDKLRSLRFRSFFLVRELIWKITNWRTEELHAFLDDYKPEVIFSFCLDSVYYLDLINYCRTYTKAKLVMFFADDVYSYKNALFLSSVHQYYIRKKIKNLVAVSELLYGATPQLCEEYEGFFNKSIKPLYKICEKISPVKTAINNPLKIVYAGNLIYGRWKTLELMAQAINDINKDDIRVQLNIYTTGLITNEMKQSLNINESSKLWGGISYEKVKKILRDADMVLHVESFDKKEIRKTRLSFSTKIVDCMQSGTCLLAIGPEEVASIKILKEYDIALVVLEKSKENIKKYLLKILENPQILSDTVKKMNQVSQRKHSLKFLKENLYIPLENLCKKR